MGVGCFMLSLPALPVAVYAAAKGNLPAAGILPAIGCLGLSLGAFGTANDTALHAARSAAALGALPAAAARELTHETTVRPARLLAVHSSPKAAFFILLAAMSLMGFTGRQILRALAE